MALVLTRPTYHWRPSYGAPSLMDISRGDVPGHRHLHKFGTNEDIDIGTEDVWTHGGSINWLAAAATLNVTSLSTADASGGTGLRTLQLEGLDANFNEISEIITMNGQTIVTTAKQYIRVNRLYGLTAGSGGINAGEIHVFTGTATAGLPDDEDLVCGQISADHGQSLQAFYTIPAGHIGFLTHGFATTDAAAKPIQVKLFIRTGANAADAIWRIAMDLKTGDDFHKSYELPSPFPEKTDMRVECTADANNTYVSAGFDLVLMRTT